MSRDGILCRSCRRLRVQFEDEANRLDTRLRLVARLLQAVKSVELIEDIIPALGGAIEDHIAARRMLDKIVFGTPDDEDDYADPEPNWRRIEEALEDAVKRGDGSK